jgi:hypothetical protein
MTNDAEKAAKAYAAATNEAQVQDYLARELRRFGWTVEREPWCRTARGDRRRADLHCVGRDAIGVSAVLVIEVKHYPDGLQSQQTIDGFSQVTDYIGATAWTSSATGEPLPAPDSFALTNTWLLSGAPPRTMGDGTLYGMGDKTMTHERYLWRAGGCLLLRERPNGDLTASRWAIRPRGVTVKMERVNLKLTDWWGGR